MASPWWVSIASAGTAHISARTPPDCSSVTTSVAAGLRISSWQVWQGEGGKHQSPVGKKKKKNKEKTKQPKRTPSPHRPRPPGGGKIFFVVFFLPPPPPGGFFPGSP